MGYCAAWHGDWAEVKANMPTRPAKPPTTATPRPPSRLGGRLWPALGISVGLLALLWGEEISDQLLFGGGLDRYGIVPRSPGSLSHIFMAPFLHANFAHLIGNSVALFVLAFLNALRGLGRFVGASVVIVVLGEGLVWLLARGGNHLGASELVFGYLGLLLGAAWYERQAGAILAALLALFLYGGVLWGVLPSDPHVSWESHLFGFVAGLVAARLFAVKRVARPVSG